MAYMHKKVVVYQTLICNKRLTTDNKVYVSNMVTNVFIAHSMCIVPYPRVWLMDLQHITLTTIKQSMQVPTNADDELFFMAAREGGWGLVHLLDLQTAITCSSTLCKLTLLTFSAKTASGIWHHTYMINNSMVGHWVEALKAQGWQVWPKLRDLDWVGHFAADPALAYSLTQRGIHHWSQMTQGGTLQPREQIHDAMGAMVSMRMYNCIVNAIGHTLGS